MTFKFHFKFDLQNMVQISLRPCDAVTSHGKTTRKKREGRERENEALHKHFELCLSGRWSLARANKVT